MWSADWNRTFLAKREKLEPVAPKVAPRCTMLAMRRQALEEVV